MKHTPKPVHTLLLPQIFIGNEWHSSSSGRTFPTFNPATGVKICDVEEADKVRIWQAGFY